MSASRACFHTSRVLETYRIMHRSPGAGPGRAVGGEALSQIRVRVMAPRHDHSPPGTPLRQGDEIDVGVAPKVLIAVGQEENPIGIQRNDGARIVSHQHHRAFIRP